MTPVAHPHVEVLTAFALGEVDAATQQRLANHLATCAVCRADVDSLAETAVALTAWRDEEPPDGGLERVLAEIGAQRGRPLAATTANGWLGATLRTLASVVVGATSIYLLGLHLAELPLWTRLAIASPLRTLGAIGLAAVIFFVIGSFFTLALTPVLLLERLEAEGRRRTLTVIGPRP